MAYSGISILDIHPNASAAAAIMLDDEISTISTRNELSYNASPGRTNNMQLHNGQEAYYVPTVEFSFKYLTAERYSLFMQMVNSKGFVAKYFDTELGEAVYRSMYMSETSLEQLYGFGGNLEALIGVKLKMVSRYGYPYTPYSSDATVFNATNKYHMYQLHLYKGIGDHNPSGEADPDYV